MGALRSLGRMGQRLDVLLRGGADMNEKKETSVLGIIGMFYLCAITIGTLIGTVAFFATLTFFVYEEAFAMLRKIGTTIMQVMT